MNKQILIEQIISALQLTYENAQAAATRAYNTATDDENVAENKYDTLALEASYLAHGQAQRVAQCEADIYAFEKLRVSNRQKNGVVTVGSFVELRDSQDHPKYLLLGPCAGGLTVNINDQSVTIVTPNSPLGSALINRQVDEQISVQIAGQVVDYELLTVC